MERVTAISRLREPMTIAEFLDWENQEDEKYEYFEGVIRMMTGGSANHVAITDNARAALRRIAGARGCLIASDFKLATEIAVTYPDVMLICPRPEGSATHTSTAGIIIEVLSKSTERYDRGAKWDAYRSVGGLKAYLLVHQSSRRIELFRRAGDDWLLSDIRSGSFDVPGFPGAISIDEIYDGVKI